MANADFRVQNQKTTMPHTLIIFGASGDLTSRKLIPALYSLFEKGRLPPETRIVGFSRTEYTHEEWRAKLAESTAKFEPQHYQAESFARFAQQLFYCPGDIGTAADFLTLRDLLDKLENDQPCDRVYYLSTSPVFYTTAISQLGQAGLATEDRGQRRIVIEKPFGTDLASARQLNAHLHTVFAESQVYRIDHYLGKETVQNILVLRFANTIFEPIWNRRYIDHVQITVAEEVVVGRRGDYYDTAGVLRDMFQNHILQLLMVIAMEPPARFRADSIRDEKVKVLQAIPPLTPAQVATESIRAQYAGYLTEPGVKPDSITPTFAAFKLEIDNWRWKGVPIYLRSGKGMSCRTTQIVIQFREPPTLLFSRRDQLPPQPNMLVIQVQPAEGIQLHIQSKVPDAGMKLRQTALDFRFQREFPQNMPEAYQRLLLDALTGDASLFARADEVEQAWAIIDPILEAWKTSGQPPMDTYEKGLWGPERSTDWMRAQGREWFDLCPVLG
ncbi:MAG: glucose-6-phosphate dehydrogenase [Pirellulales bacterium]|nr:glucose-6-phosphate dehydrogenase [Pirellulales bacterium]